MGAVRLIEEEVDSYMEDLIRRAATLLGFDLPEIEVRDIMVDDSTASEEEIFLAIKAAVVLNRG
jgi:hypothetical protein